MSTLVQILIFITFLRAQLVNITILFRIYLFHFIDKHNLRLLLVISHELLYEKNRLNSPLLNIN